MTFRSGVALNGNTELHHDVFGDAAHPTLLLVNGRGSQCINDAVRASAPRAERLRAVRVPTLVIHGDRDTLIDQIGGRRTAELVPGARFELIEGLGHDHPPQLWPRCTDLVVGHIRDHS